MVDDIRMPLSEWTMRHNRWADGEVAELEVQGDCGRVYSPTHAATRPSANVSCDRNTINCHCLSGPSPCSSIATFSACGFLDGTEGLIFWVLQTFWFRFLVDAKIWEKRQASRLAGEYGQARILSKGPLINPALKKPPSRVPQNREEAVETG